VQLVLHLKREKRENGIDIRDAEAFLAELLA
jgi:hypothetical protein